MKKTLQATYSNGHLLLNEKLNPAWEGAQVRVVILGTEVNEQASGASIHPIEQREDREDEEPKASRMAVLTKWARRRSAKSGLEAEGEQEPAHQP